MVLMKWCRISFNNRTTTRLVVCRVTIPWGNHAVKFKCRPNVAGILDLTWPRGTSSKLSKLTWQLKIPACKRRNIYKPPNLGFTVNFRGCCSLTPLIPALFQDLNPQPLRWISEKLEPCFLPFLSGLERSPWYGNPPQVCWICVGERFESNSRTDVGLCSLVVERFGSTRWAPGSRYTWRCFLKWWENHHFTPQNDDF